MLRAVRLDQVDVQCEISGLRAQSNMLCSLGRLYPSMAPASPNGARGVLAYYRELQGPKLRARVR